MRPAPNIDQQGLTPWPVAPTDRRRVLLLLGAATLLRGTYLIEYVALPFLEGPLFDSVVYLRQAQSIHGGRFADPSLLGFSPLYGWFLALFGSEPRLLPVIAQLLLGVGTLYLLHRAAAALFDEVTALCAGLLWTGYGLVVFYETKLMSETLGLALLVSAFTALASASFRRGRLATTGGAGLLLSLAVLARASLLFMLPLFALAALLPWTKEDVGLASARVRRSVGLALTIALALGAHGLHNLTQSGLFVPVILPSHTAAEASRADWSGRLDVFGAAPSPWDVVDQARERLARAARGEPEPATPGVDVVGLLTEAPKKAALTFRDTETSFDYGYYGERSEVRALVLLPLSFGAMACLALLGAVWLARTRGLRALVPHLPMLLGVLAVTAAFHPSSRYRLPLVIPFVLLGGYAIRRVVALDAPRRWIGVAAILVLVIGFALPTYTGARLSRPALWEVRVAEAAVEAGWYEEALRRAERARVLAGEDAEVKRRLDRLGASTGQ